MTEILIAMCAWLAWEPAENATKYDVYVDNIFVETTIEPTYQICGVDTYTEHLVHVVGLNADDEAGEPSDPLTVVWHFNFDSNGDGVVGFADVGGLQKEWRHCNNGIKEVPCP